MVEHSPDIISVMTYNIHSGVNRDGNVRLQPVAQVIRELNPDIVALQEVDMGITHRRYRHQAKVLSERLEMEFFFFPLVTSIPPLLQFVFASTAVFRNSCKRGFRSLDPPARSGRTPDCPLPVPD